MSRIQSDSQQSTREQACAELLREALKHPGIRKAMHVYKDWRNADRGLDSYRAATWEPHCITTTDRANR